MIQGADRGHEAAGQALPAGRAAQRLEELAGDGAEALRSLSDGALLRAWSEAMTTLRDASSALRRTLDPLLVESSRLSPEGLDAALDVVLRGAAGESAHRLFERARPCRAPGVTLVILASNPPGLAVQTLLPALAQRRPLVLKSPTAEPHFAPALRRLLVERLPEVGAGLLCTAWRGGERELEDEVFPLAERIVVYGNAATVADVEERAPGRVVALGPKISCAVVSKDCDPTTIATGLARDTALFDQRGCLSLQAVVTDGDAAALASTLADALRQTAETLPPGTPTPAEAAAVQQLRLEAEMRGLEMHRLELAAGTVLVEPATALAPSPGLRTVRIHPFADLAQALATLAHRRSVLQGAALAGEAAWALRPALTELGITRCAPPGELQHADAAWRNGGFDPLELVAPS